MGTTFKVLVKTPVSEYSGYGNDGIGLIRALHRWGADVYVQPTWVDSPIPQDILPLFAKRLVPPFDLTVNHWDPTNLGIGVESRQCTRLAVAWTMWEFAPAPGPVTMTRRDGSEYLAEPKSGMVPICHKRTTLKERLKWYDLVLGYDQVTIDSLTPYIPADVARGVLIGGYDSENWNFVQRDWHGEFMFGMHGALNNRKQPFLVLQAFMALKEEHPEEFASARLAFHTTVPPLFAELNNILADKRVHVFFEAWDHDTLQEFYAQCHCLVYPSHGEGKNVPCLEHMTTGGVVIHSNYGGPAQWLREDLAYPLPYKLAPVLDKRPDAAHWAQVNLQDVKDAMWHVFTHRAEARQKGELASRVIPSQLDWAYTVEALFRRIRDLCPAPAKGEEIYALAMACRRDPREGMEAGGRFGYA